MSFETFQAEKMQEIQPIQFGDRATEIFSEFGWNEKDFLKSTHEYFSSLRETKESDELTDFKDRFSEQELYTFSPKDFVLSGPNCEAFALNTEKNPLTGKPFTSKPFPGAFAHGFNSECRERGDEILYFGSKDEQKSFYKQMLSDDAKALGREFKEVDADYKTKEGETMIAMVASENIFDNPDSIGDFHFYRKGESGTWFHKPGLTEVTNLDASGKVISNPETCNRGGYGNFLGYYVWKNIN